MKYAFNKKLFRNLYKVLGCKRRYLIELVDTTPTTFDYWYQSCDLPFEKLVILCNKLHFSISHFIISADDSPELHSKEYYYTDKWRDITIRFRLLADDVSIHRGLTMREAIKQMGVSSRTFYSYFYSGELPVGMKVGKLIDIFNNSVLYPGDYIIDNNKDILLLDGFKKRDVSNEQQLHAALVRASRAEAQKKNAEAQKRRINSELEEKIARLESLVAKLTKQGKDMA